MANTLIAISNVSVGVGGSQTMEWTSIPNTYDDLLLKLSIRSSYAATSVGHRFRINSDTGSNYSELGFYGDGSTPATYSYSGTSYITLGLVGANATSNTFTSVDIYIPKYKSSSSKSIFIEHFGENNATTAYIQTTTGLWSSSSTITSLLVDLGSGNTAVQYSYGTLYGIHNT